MTLTHRVRLVGTLAMAALTATVAAQDAALKFDVASIKAVELAPGPTVIRTQFQAGGRFVGTNVTLIILLQSAFREPDQPLVRPNEILNAPAWATSQRYNIDAREPAELADQQLTTTSPAATALLRSLLEDRFKLQAHVETREMQVFALKLARSDGTLGPNMKPSKDDCAAIGRERAAAAGRGAPAPPPQMPAPGQVPQCAAMMRSGELAAGGTTASALPALLAVAVPGATIVDHTGLTGSYDIDIRFAPETPVRASPNGAPDTPLPDAPSIFTALEEQLGLKLESTHELRRVVVIDHVERPSPD